MTDVDISGPWARSALFFVFGCATSAAQVALLSMLTFYSQQFGPQIFIALNCATFLPSLPIVLIQSKLDSAYDRIFSTYVAFKFRIAISLLLLTATLCALPLLPLVEEWELLACATIIGIFTGVLFGSFYQLLTFIHAEEQTTNTAYFAFGYQGSGLVVLSLSLVAFRGHEDAPTSEMLRQFFSSVAVIPLVGLILFLTLTASESFRESARLRDVSVSDYDSLLGREQSDAERAHHSEQTGDDQALLRSLGGEHVGSLGREHAHDCEREAVGGEGGPLLSKAQVLEKCFPCAACIFVTIFSSIVVFPFYTFVPSTNPTFPMVLFYTKNLFDTVSRPLTTVFKCSPPPHHLLALALLRLALFVPAFFLYITPPAPGEAAAWYVDDTPFCVAIAVFSFLSGYLVTAASQAAPKCVPLRYRTQVTNART
jgi:hypothetical protein